MRWRKASYSSNGQDSCVELARVASWGQVAVRDSKDPDGDQHRLSVDVAARLFTEIKAGQHDLR